jgi:hypothetical protein
VIHFFRRVISAKEKQAQDRNPAPGVIGQAGEWLIQQLTDF